MASDYGQIFEGNLVGEGLKFAVVVSRFNEFVTGKLLDGCQLFGRNRKRHNEMFEIGDTGNRGIHGHKFTLFDQFGDHYPAGWRMNRVAAFAFLKFLQVVLGNVNFYPDGLQVESGLLKIFQ